MSISTIKDPRDPAIVNRLEATRVQNKKDFKAMAASRQELRAIRATTPKACTKCRKTDRVCPGLTLKTCAKCNDALYCSKECQKADWSLHKKFCEKTEGPGIIKLIDIFSANRVLDHYLQACFILQFDLLYRRTHFDAPFLARVDFGVEPVQIPDFFRIFDGEALPDRPLTGMLQVNGFTPLPSKKCLSPTHREIWLKGRERWREITGHAESEVEEKFAVGLVVFGRADSEHGSVYAINILDAAKNEVRCGEPWRMTSAITGEVTEMPFNIDNCLRFMNKHVRDDHKNQLRLRTQMQPADVQVIRDAAGNVDTPAARLLRAKIAPDPAYCRWLVGPGTPIRP
ncbi:hypothetical protein GGX14DRAFT_443524 [Mycena pura]|uniref:MYND-type domain-containing protein n=1 Tax=Mycena pura TaxID=153505 RepID=A0AAD6YED9_9AGAR|nr:hypothetical protein GGX14DRAFT_443524 [Mycena pura]